MNCKYKSFMTKKKAFTLIELLIVIAIIGILFIVLVSKVDFATDKAKATGVQTDFRSFQLALETVSKEKAGFNSFGWNTGDANANGVRDSIDEGDANEDGMYQDGETWTGHKKYLETWTNKYSLIKPGTTFEADGYDKDAIFALETAINKNLDPKLHITIDAKTGLITMANGAQDPWNTQYHGAYISAEDGMDRGAIVIYSNGANQKFGSEHDIANGVPTVIVPDNNKDGADDYSLVVCYTYTNGYGEVGNLTTGFSNNQTFLTGNGGSVSNAVNPGGNGGTLQLPAENPSGDLDNYTWSELKALAQANLSKDDYKNKYGIEPGDKIVSNGTTYILVDLGTDNDGDGVQEAGEDYDGFVFMYNAGISFQMNANNCKGGYINCIESDQLKQSDGKTTIDNLYNDLTDADLKNSIKKVKITSTNVDVTDDGKYFAVTTHNADVYMFLASAKEVGFKVSGWSYADNYLAEGTKFDYFLEGTDSDACNKRIEIFSSSIGWLRSATPVILGYFTNVSMSGTSNSSKSNNKYAAVPVFVIG